MNKIEELQHLNELHKNIEEFESIECKDVDVKVIERAIKRVEKEVREQAEKDLFSILNGEKTINQIREGYGMEKIHDGNTKYKILNTNPIKREEVTKETFLPIIGCENRGDILTIHIRNGIFTKGIKDLSNVSTDDLATELSKRPGALTIEKESMDKDTSEFGKELIGLINNAVDLKTKGYKNKQLVSIVEEYATGRFVIRDKHDIRNINDAFSEELQAGMR